MISYRYTKQEPKLSELSCEHAPSFYKSLECIPQQTVYCQHTELYEQYSVYDGVDDGQNRTSSGDMSVVNVESLIRKTCSPHEDVVSASKNPDPRKRSVGHDASAIGHVPPKLMRFFVPAVWSSVIRLLETKNILLLDVVRYQTIVRCRKIRRK